MARLLEAIRKGEDVALVYMTDGGDYSARRDNETRTVLARAGVRPDRLFFVGSQLKLPDGKLYQHADRAFAALDRVLDTLPRPSKSITHAWEGGHQDHDCVHAIAVLALQSRGLGGTTYQMPFYREIRRLRKYFAPCAPLAENGPVERAYRPWNDVIWTLSSMFSYGTQWRTFRWHGPAMLLRRMLTPWDSLQPVSIARLSERPHAGQLHYERRFNTRWEDVSQAVSSLASRVVPQ